MHWLPRNVLLLSIIVITLAISIVGSYMTWGTLIHRLVVNPT